jgi:predicted kinase
MQWVVEGNARGLEEFVGRILERSAADAVTSAARRAADRLGQRLDRRRRDGFIRHCHGDLHLGNIVLFDGRPTPFDAIEFNDEITAIDVLYDVAFLVMDLWRLDLRRHANAFWNRYVRETLDYDGMELLPLFLGCRAAVRAKTSATAAGMQDDREQSRSLEALAGQYLEMAHQLLNPPAPYLVAVGGLSGSGKSTFARALAPLVGAVPGATVLRTDEIRKELSGVDSLVRLGPDAYTLETSRRVYSTQAERAGAVVRSGHGAIAEGVFQTQEERAAIERVADDARVPFVGLWLEAHPDVLMARVRSRNNDASDAGVETVQEQLARDPGPLRWRRIDGAQPIEALLREGVALLRR